MAVRYDPLLASALGGEIERTYGGARVAALGVKPEAWTAVIVFLDGRALWCFLHPMAGHMLAGERSPLSPLLADRGAWRKARKRGSFRAGGWSWVTFRALWLAAAETPPDERLLSLCLADEGESIRTRVLIDLPRNRRNVLLLRPARESADSAGGVWRIASVLRSRPGRTGGGEPYSEPVSRRAGAAEPIELKEWASLLAEPSPERRREAALRHVAYLSPINVDYILLPQSAEAAYERYRDVLEGAEERLIPRTWGLQPYRHALGEPAAAAVPSLLAGMERSAEEDGVSPRVGEPSEATARPDVRPDSEQVARVAAALRRKRRRLERRLAAVRAELQDGEPPERIREIGHLLLARLTEVPAGVRRVELTDFEGTRRTIQLDPRLPPAENAERYYQAAARRERAVQRLPDLISTVDRELGRVESGLEELARTGEADPRLRALAEVPDAKPRGPWERAERLPYRAFVSSGNLEIRVGRGSKDNDELTFHHSSPEDIWLHVRQAPGAHVILRWGRRDQDPPERDLRDAAVLAAVHSDARHSGVVAVDWTRRKHVRKPRKATPGVVAPERVKTLFVEPDASAAQRMRRAP